MEYNGPEIVALFWRHVEKTKTCWLWTGSCNKDGGYGNAYNGKSPIGAHRMSWILAYGDIPDKLYVLHTCDTPNCVNPEHLFLGTVKDNARDMFEKGRQPNLKGQCNSQAKLTNDDVLAIRELIADGDMLQTEIALVYGVSKQAITMLKNGHTWAHL